MKKANLLLLFIILFLSFTYSESSLAQDTAVPDHEGWTALLEEYVQSDGLVNYQGILAEKEILDAYTQLLSDNPPSGNWTNEEQLAYWINAYNAFTVKLIVDNYPVESIKDLNPTISIPTVYSVWTKEWFQIGGEDFSLDKIEHKVIRSYFNEPRIHFAINCASISCPVLRPEAYEPDRLESQLEEQAKLFMNDESRNKIDPEKPYVSKIFSWFTSDFTQGQTVVEFINKYSEEQIDPKVRLRFMDYNWALNEYKGSN